MVGEPIARPEQLNPKTLSLGLRRKLWWSGTRRAATLSGREHRKARAARFAGQLKWKPGCPAKPLVVDAFDIRTHQLQLFLQPLVSAIKVINATHSCLALGSKCGDDQAH